ncbi:hypothetical protein [Iamia sp.]|uniref:hypothetical protein n=1 Tax=Iamia sp. TaxID=2722710 RepID=UPI002C5E2E00|nr:hypothetical protein [Iamia sp.]HXH56608.1 hypothetical protein [Iamia sp.]
MIDMMPPAMPMPQGPMTPFQAAPELDLGFDPALLEELLGKRTKKFEPRYKPGFDPTRLPKKPDPERITADAIAQERRHVNRLAMQMETANRLRLHIKGVFESDLEARELGDQDPWTSSELVDDWNLLCSFGANIDPFYTKSVRRREDRIHGQTLEDFGRFLREEAESRWVDGGDMYLAMAEWKLLTVCGEVVSRNLPNLDDEGYPISHKLVNPMTVYPVFGGERGLIKLYRKYRTTYADAVGDWGEPSKQDRARWANTRGNGRDTDDTMVTVTEYWDEWWRSITIDDGIVLMEVKKHALGEVPYVVQRGPGGEPWAMDAGLGDTSGGGDADGWREGLPDDADMGYKSTSSIWSQRERHDQTEAIAARVLTQLKKNDAPPVVMTRSNEAANAPGGLPEIDWRKGGITELLEGEAISPMPTNTSALDLQMLMGLLNTDRLTGGLPPQMGGANQQSNVSGTAMSTITEGGMDKTAGWIRTMELYRSRVLTQQIRLWRNVGHLSRFSEGEERPFLVAVSAPSGNSDLGREVTPELIDAIGPDVTVKLTRVRSAEMVPILTAIQMGNQLGIITKRRGAEMLGIGDYDRVQAEWQEEMALSATAEDEQFRKLVIIPMQLARSLEEATDPRERAMYEVLLDKWMEIQQPPPPDPMAAMGGQPPPPGMGAPPPGMPPGMTPGANPVTPGASGGISYAALGQGPGSVSGQQGGPQGPTGPHPPMLPFEVAGP